jgi:peptidoglycan/LPS O-acetylase OafA/YrhL
MAKRLLLLSGIAIMAVIINHTAGWGFTAMFWWADSFRPVEVPCFDQIGTLPYYVLLVLQQLTVFSVPSFLFASGFFAAYASRGSQYSLNWKTLKVRIQSLIFPYFIWSVLVFVSEILQGVVSSPIAYLERIISGGASEGYFYVPLLVQFYLLSPLIAALIHKSGKLALLASGLLQLSSLGLRYIAAYGNSTSVIDLMIRITPGWAFPRMAFFFTFGMFAGFNLKQLKQWMIRHKWYLLISLVLLGLLSIFQPQAPLHESGVEWGRSLASISSQLYAVAFILCFVAFDGFAALNSSSIYQIGKHSFGIFLIHPLVIEFVARAIRKVAPWILAYQLLLFQPLLFIAAMGIPLFFMTTVARSSLRKHYRYFFG